MNRIVGLLRGQHTFYFLRCIIRMHCLFYLFLIAEIRFHFKQLLLIVQLCFRLLLKRVTAKYVEDSLP